MIEIEIIGFGLLRVTSVVLDFNGTLAVDGQLLPGVGEALCQLSETIQVHVLTADTHGSVAAALEGLPVHLKILSSGGNGCREDVSKVEYLRSLGSEECVAIGNGRNDRLMLGEAALGVGVCQAEGASFKTLSAADILAPDILTALQLLLKPGRLKATLRF